MLAALKAVLADNMPAVLLDALAAGHLLSGHQLHLLPLEHNTGLLDLGAYSRSCAALIQLPDSCLQLMQ